MRAPPQWRAVLLGAGTWLGCLAAWGWWSDGKWLAVVIGLATGLGLLPLRRRGAGLVAVAVAAGAVATSAWWATARPAVLAQAADGQDVLVVGTVLEQPRARHGEHIGERPWARGTLLLEVLQIADGQPVRIRSPTVVRGDPAAVQAWPRGTVVRVSGRMSVSSWWREPPVSVDVRDAEVIRPPSGVAMLVWRLRSGLAAALSERSPDAASLVAGLAIGDESRQSGPLGEAMQDSGLSHLTAVSGGNVSIVVGMAVALVALLRGRLGLRVIAAMAVLISYAVVVGPEPSVLRASAMGAIALLSVLSGRPGAGMPLLGLATAGLLLVRPQLALSWGFALSVAATAGIVLGSPPLAARLRQRWPATPAAITAAVAVTLAAQIATAPLLAAMTGRLPVAGVIANLLAAPLVAPITIGGLAIMLLAPIHPGAAGAVGVAVAPLGDLLAWIARFSAGLPGAVVEVPGGAAGGALVCALLLLALWGLRRHGWRRQLTLLLAAALATAMLLAPGNRGVPRGWVFLACDVGQGDAFLVRAGPREAVLIDTGPRAEPLIECLAAAGVDSIPLVVVTHFDADHVAALPQLLARHSPRIVAVSAVSEPSANAADARAAVSASGARLVIAEPGQRWQAGAAVLEVVWPRRVIRSGSVGNNSAVALAITVAGVQILTTGDLEPLGQAGLMASLADVDFDVTTIPHHGSANQHPDFQSWTKAEIALVSAGEGNRFGHPRPEALDLATAAGQLVGRTDLHGTLAVVPTGQGLRLVGQQGLGERPPPGTAPMGSQRTERQPPAVGMPGKADPRGAVLLTGPAPLLRGAGAGVPHPGGMMRSWRRRRPEAASQLGWMLERWRNWSPRLMASRSPARWCWGRRRRLLGSWWNG